MPTLRTIEPRIAAVIQQGELNALRRTHWLEIRKQSGIKVTAKTLESNPRIYNEAKKVIKKMQDERKSSPAAPAASLDVETTALSALVAKAFPASDSKEAKALADFSKNLVAESASVQGAAPQATGLTAAQMAAKVILGQLIYLLDTDAKKASLITGDLKADKAAVQTAFGAALTAAAKDMTDKINTEATFVSSSPASLRAAYLPKAIAKLLVTNDGFLNLSISQQVQTQLFDSANTLTYQDYAKALLAKYETQSQLQTIFAQVDGLPAGSRSLELAIASSYDPSSCTGTKVDMQRAFLAAHLTLIEQGPVGNCFAVSVAKLVQDGLPERIAQDIADVLKNGSLTRKVDGQDVTLEYVTTGNDYNLLQPIQLDVSGAISIPKKSTAAYLASFIPYGSASILVQNSQALVRATRAMGIAQADHEQAVKDAIKRMADKAKVTQVQTTLQALILELAQNDQTKADKGFFGATSITTNSANSAVVGIFADMAELSKRSLVRGKILACIQEGLFPAFTSKKAPKDDVLTNLFAKVLAQVNSKLDIQYNSNTQVPDPSKKASDGQSISSGSFVMKDVQTPEQFRTFVMDAVKITLDSASAEDKAALTEKRVKKINEFVMGQTFLKNALVKYDPANAKVQDPDKEWETLESVPWRDPSGDNPFEIMSFYFNQIQKLATFKIQNAQELWQALIEFDRKVNEKNKDQTGVQEAYELCSPQHAFRKTPTELYNIGVNSPVPPADFVAGYLKGAESLLNTQVAITPEQQAEVIGWVSKYLIPADEDYQAAFTVASGKYPKHKTLGKLRESVLKTLQPLVAPLVDEKSFGKYVRRLDHYLHTAKVPAELVAQMTSLAVPFADTNWTQDGHSIFFCFYPDLIAKQIRLGIVNDDGTNLAPMNQNEWVNDQVWTISKTAVDIKV